MKKGSAMNTPFKTLCSEIPILYCYPARIINLSPPVSCAGCCVVHMPGATCQGTCSHTFLLSSLLIGFSSLQKFFIGNHAFVLLNVLHYSRFSCPLLSRMILMIFFRRKCIIYRLYGKWQLPGTSCLAL